MKQAATDVEKRQLCLTELSHALKIDPTNSKALYRKAKLLLMSGQLDNAAEIVKNYLSGQDKTDEAEFTKLI